MVLKMQKRTARIGELFSVEWRYRQCHDTMRDRHRNSGVRQVVTYEESHVKGHDAVWRADIGYPRRKLDVEQMRGAAKLGPVWQTLMHDALHATRLPYLRLEASKALESEQQSSTITN